MSQTVQTRPEETTAKIPNYRQVVRRALPDEFFRPDYWSLAWIPVHFAIIALCYWGLTSHFSFWTAPLLALVIGHSFGCLGFVAHDICHGGTIKQVALRDVLSGVCFSPLAIGPYLWRRWHNADHHNNTQVEGVDPDHLFTMEEYAKNPVLRFLYRLSPLLRNLVIFGSFSFRMTQQMTRMAITYLVSKKSTTRDRVVIIAQYLVPLIGWGVLTFALGSQVFWWGYFIPVLVANTIVIAYIATNHFLNPLADERDVLATSLTVTLPKWMKIVDVLHSHFGAHVSHHLFPQAPARFSRQIEEKIRELYPDRYHSMPLFRALYLLWKTPWVYDGQTVLVDPHRGERHPTLGNGLK